MNLHNWFSLALVLLTVPAVAGMHDVDCTPGGWPPASYNTIDLSPIGGPTYYVEERGPTAREVAGVLVPGSGTFGDRCEPPADCLADYGFGDGTWVYEEANGIPGPQRGGVGLLGDWFPPGCDTNPDWQPTDGTAPCLLIDEDPVEDETCGHGPDRLIV